MTYERLKALIGTAEAPSRLQELESIVNAVPSAEIGLSRQGLLAAFEVPRLGQEEVVGFAARLQARSSQVSFKDLYTAVVALQASEDGHCPACDTPLTEVHTSPYEKAAAGLIQLKELGELQAQLATAQAKVASASRELRRQLAALSAFLVSHGEQDTTVGHYLAGLGAEPLGEWWTPLYPVTPAYRMKMQRKE